MNWKVLGLALITSNAWAANSLPRSVEFLHSPFHHLQDFFIEDIDLKTATGSCVSNDSDKTSYAPITGPRDNVNPGPQTYIASDPKGYVYFKSPKCPKDWAEVSRVQMYFYRSNMTEATLELDLDMDNETVIARSEALGVKSADIPGKFKRD